MTINMIRSAAALLGALAVGSASASSISEWSSIGDFQQAGGLATAFNSAPGLATTFDNTAGLATRPQKQGARFSLEAAGTGGSTDTSNVAANANSMIAFPNDLAAPNAFALQTTLWNFVSDVRSQQVNLVFNEASANANAIAYNLQGQVPEVPLPSPMWLLAAGIACLVTAHRRTRAR